MQLWTTFNYSYLPPSREIQLVEGSDVTSVERCFGSKLDVFGGLLASPSICLKCSPTFQGQHTLIRT